jgi:LysM repeat protein
MYHRISVILFFLLTFVSKASAQKISPEQYISQYKDLAISEMKRMGIPAAITLAQGILESESGNSDLAQRSNNHFGIKCKSTWTGDSVSHDDDEKGECFRAYKNVDESYRDHSNFLKGSVRYANLFQLDPTDYKGWAYGLKNAGYATNPRYPEILIRNIEKYNLGQYDLFDAREIPSDIAKANPDPVRVSPAQFEKEVSKNDVPVTGNTKMVINGSKAIFVAEGTSLLAIASRNNIKLSKLLEMNDLTKDGLLAKAGVIFLEKKKKEGNRNMAVVQNGQTLYEIAQNYGIILKNLCEYNHLDEDAILPSGTQLFLKPQQESSQRLTSSNQETSPSGKDNKTTFNLKSHEVLQGEGLYAISKKYGVSVDNLKEWNKLKNNELQIGEVLIISK